MTRKPRGSNPRNLTPEQIEYKRKKAKENYWENAEEMRRKKREEAASDRDKARKRCAEYARNNRSKISAHQKEKRKSMSAEEREQERKTSLDYYHKNKEKVDAQKKEYRKKHPEKFINEKNRERNRKYHKENKEKIMKRKKENLTTLKSRLKNYGITIEEYCYLLESQGRKCAICGMSDISNCKLFPVVDHCHTNNHVRGLLCANCNRGLGMFKDSPALLRKAAKYVEKNGLFGPIMK
jgi:hypothetical protein